MGSNSCSCCGLAYMCSPDLVFSQLDWPLAHPTQKSTLLYNVSHASFGNDYLFRLKVESVHSNLPFWVSRGSFVMFSKPIAKPMRRWKLCPESGIHCTRSQVKVVFCYWIWKTVWLEHVCKVCARCTLLLRFYDDYWCEAVLGSSGHQWSILCIFSYLGGGSNRNIAWI